MHAHVKQTSSLLNSGRSEGRNAHDSHMQGMLLLPTLVLPLAEGKDK